MGCRWKWAGGEGLGGKVEELGGWEVVCGKMVGVQEWMVGGRGRNVE